ncbi:hypothetical protein MNBD_GAMMA08-1292 [hydrothermal vent metagenome]|uniref:Uncharacterized protein n=1 Tax=hydrothermal vent metagenome TaxID=652676 RepID=A0A3B0WX92_9ZZZZ
MLSTTTIAEQSARDKYIEAYTAHLNANISTIAKSFELEGLTAEQVKKRVEFHIEKTIACHDRDIDFYPEPMKSALMGTIASGGSYTDAINALRKIIIKAKSEKNEVLLQQYIAIIKKGSECTNG